MMDNPVILAVDHDEMERGTVARDLERRFGADYRVMAVDSATQGLATLEAMRDAGEEVAVILAARDLPEMTGIAFLDRADDLHPTAERGLLVSPGPVDLMGPIRRAMLFDHLDFQVPSPWISPEEWVYPTITEALSAWTQLHRPRAEAVTIVDRQWSARGHEIRDLLERSGVPYGFYAVDSDRGQDLMATYGVRVEQLPVAIHRNGTVQRDPSNEALAEAIGVATQPPADRADVAIVGAGPAGLAAAVGGASEGLRTVVVESGALGGQAATSNQILNYPGFPRGLGGHELTTRSYYQALLFGASFVFTRRAVRLESEGGGYILILDNGSRIESRAVVLATGRAPKRLDIPALEALVGRGVFYGATGAEAAALQGESVGVVGGANSAGQAALDLAKHAARVTLFVRGDSLAPAMSDYLIQRIDAAENIAVRFNTRIVGGIGQRRLRALELEEKTTGERETLSATALFVEIGGEAHTSWIPPAVARDEREYLLTGRNLQTDPGRSAIWPLDRLPFPLETSLPGVFAAGDVRHGSANRVAPAVGDGAVAIRSVHEYLREVASPERAATPVMVSQPGIGP